MSTKRKLDNISVQNSTKQQKTKKIGNTPEGARVQNPYTNLPRIPNPLFKTISEESINAIRINKQSKYFPFVNNGKSIEEQKFAKKVLLEILPGEFKDIFGFINEERDKHGTLPTMRDYIEPVGADQQCKKSGITEFIQGETICWLCGCVIKEKSNFKACEHIIPAVRAILLKGIITTDHILDKIHDLLPNVDTYKNMVKNNYLWAHDDCNGSGGKGSMVLIEYDKSIKKFVPNDALCAELDSNIRKLTTEKHKKNRNCYYGYTNGIPINYTGTNIVKTPYEAYVVEMEYQCRSINDEFK